VVGDRIKNKETVRLKMIKLVRNILLVVFIFGIGYIFGIKEVRFYKIVSSSMVPTLEVNDRIIAIKPDKLERKNIVVVRDPQGSDDILAKRIIGLPGEKIEIKYRAVFINGEKISEPYIKEKPSYLLEKKSIPSSSYFLLGDNRNKSEDSSVWGPVKAERIVGRVICLYYPFKKFKVFIQN